MQRPSAASSPNRILSMLAGAAFVVGAFGWLIVQQQRRRASMAIQQTVRDLSPEARSHVSRIWRVIRDIWVDPWGRYRSRVAADARGDVLEIGVGQWPNLRYYTVVKSLTGVERSRRNIFAARRRIRRWQRDAVIRLARPEALPFPDASFDTVVTSLSLCSVRDQNAALREIKRVLRPGGTLRFLEHVRSQRPTVAYAQDIIMPFWRTVAQGCHPNRDTVAAIHAADFAIDALESVPGAWGITYPTVCGVASLRDAVHPQQPHQQDKVG